MYKFRKSFYDIRASIILMPLDVFQKLGLGAPKPTTIRLLMANRSVNKHVGVLFYMAVKVDQFIVLSNFVILVCDVDCKIPIIIGMPFLATRRALAGVELGKLKFWVNKEEVSFNVCKYIKQPMNLKLMSVVDEIDDEVESTFEA